MRQSSTLLLLPTLAVGLLLCGCRPTSVSGVVFLDANRNSVRDAGETPLAGVAVSDGYEIALTDTHGRYRLENAALPALVRLTVPTGYWPRADRWFQRVAGPEPHADFPLDRRGQSTPWRFVQVSDIHYVAPARPLLRRFVQEVANLQPPPDLIIATGDLVHDVGPVTAGEVARRVFLQYLAAMSGLPAPLLNLPGNHDLPGYSGTLSPNAPLFGVRGYEAAIGPAWYSLDYADVHLIFLLTTRRDPASGRPREGLPAECRAWLARDLQVTPRARPLLIFAHQPPRFWQGSVAALLHGRRLLGVFCGHNHRAKVYRQGDWTVYEAGALSGGWWLGPGPEDSPRGYRLVTIGPEGVISAEYRRAP